MSYDDVLGYDSLGNAIVVRPGQQGARPGYGQQMPFRPGMPRPPMQMVPGGMPPMGVPLQAPPFWRQPQAAPGVMQPFEGLVPLQMVPDLNGGILTAAVPTVTFTGRPQKPYRGQRVVAVINRSAGNVSQPRIIGGIQVGTDLQAASIGDTPLEVFSPTAFGVELVLTPAGPGIDVVIRVSTPAAVPGGESVAISIVILGRYIA